MLYRGAALSPAPLFRTDSRAKPGSPESPGGNHARPSETCPGDSVAPSPGSLYQSGFSQPPSRSPRRPAGTPPGAGAAFGTARGAVWGWNGPGGRAGAEGSGQGSHPALSRPSGAAAILAGRGRRRGAGNGGRGAVRALGAPSALRAPLATERGFYAAQPRDWRGKKVFPLPE